jgi:hypothetical protein
MPHTFILIECVDPRVTKGQEATRTTIRGQLGDDAIELHDLRTLGPSPLLAGNRHVMSDGLGIEERDMFMRLLVWCIAHIERHSNNVGSIIIASHDGGCAAEYGDDLREHNTTIIHLLTAANFVCSKLEEARANGKIKGIPVVLRLLQHIEGDAVVSAEFIE